MDPEQPLITPSALLPGLQAVHAGKLYLKNTRTRLIIYSDKGSERDDEKYRRFFGIVYEDKENPDQWIAATQGTYLPGGIYFDADLSDAATGFRLEYPRSVSKAVGSGDEFSYYEFSSNGNMSIWDDQLYQYPSNHPCR